MEKNMPISLSARLRAHLGKASLKAALIGSFCLMPLIYGQNAYGQTPNQTPNQTSDTQPTNTTQTDQSEEDWRNSRKKSETPDIFEDIRNGNSTGSGIILGPQNPIDILPEDSRRHLMKERAKLLATQMPGEPVSAPYTPSEAAKQDAALEQEEREAWNDIVKDIVTDGSGASGDAPSDSSQQGSASDPNSSDPSAPNSGSSDPSSSDPSSSDPSSGDSQDNAPITSPIRGGSTHSAAQILSQIKGLGGQPTDSTDIANGVPAPQNISLPNPSQSNPAQPNQTQLSQAQQNQAQQSSVSQDPSQNGSSQNGSQDSQLSPLDYIRNQKNSTSNGTATSASDYILGR